jgi:YD repeat-containing protein
MGRPTLKFQQIGTTDYKVEATYNCASAITQLKYPSDRTVTYAYDPAGRLNVVNGGLGGAQRTYSTGVIYSPTGGVSKEQYGTDTAIYNKLFYNSRGQLAEILASTSYTGPSDKTWDRGAIVNGYSSLCTGDCSGSSMSDNNGNLLKQQIYIPGHEMRWQQYDYDSLNRLNSAREMLDGGAEQWKQQFTYDRWGNRTINTGVTYGVGINNKAFTVNTVNNQLGIPGGQSGAMQYDAAGNLTNDTYTGAGNRTYDAENKITSAWGGNNLAQLYGYDASGRRIKRTVDGVQTWHVYGLGGELLAEYLADGAVVNPQKEYAYRNGQLLIVATSSTGSSHSLSVNGSSAYVQVPNSTSINITGAITVEAWIKPNSIGAYQYIASRETYGVSGTGGGYELTLNNVGKARFDLYHSHNTYTPVIGSTTLTTGQWHHVAGVWDGSYLRIMSTVCWTGLLPLAMDQLPGRAA